MKIAGEGEVWFLYLGSEEDCGGGFLMPGFEEGRVMEA